MPLPPLVTAPHAQPPADVAAQLQVDPRRGLSEEEAQRRRHLHGANRLHRVGRRSVVSVLVAQFQSVLVALLAVAAGLSLLFGQWLEAGAIVGVLLLNGAIGFVTELRAIRSMEALRRLGSVKTRVRREGALRLLDAELLVPGDVVVLEGGDVVTADLRLLQASKLQADESMLTGESLPVEKALGAVPADTPLAERRGMLFKCTAVTRGAGEAVVVATGMRSELGRITRLVAEAKPEQTPLEQRLAALGQRLVWLTLGIAVFVAVSGIAAGRKWLVSLETAIALAVATVPEGLPIIATLALARGMHRMARRNALVNRLSAVETLGATSIIFSDKTGTLTENRMTVSEVALAPGTIEVAGDEAEGASFFRRDGAPVRAADEPLLLGALQLAVLCNDAELQESDAPIGDPLETALLVAGRKAGLRRPRLLEDLPEEREVAFDPAVKMMATIHRGEAGHLVAVKGAPECVLEASDRVATPEGEAPLDAARREAWLRRNEEMAARGLRVLAVARRRSEAPDGDPYHGLCFVALLGLLDPPREDVRDAIAACRRAGIRVVMVTGDQPGTARNIARRVGLVEDAEAPVVLGRDLEEAARSPGPELERWLDAAIFARISPEQKLSLVARHQQRGAIVAMTGDGVNDAPALRKADIGVAMGRRGTEVARQAAHIVLRDDAFATIVAAVRQGRVLFDNIRRSVLYLLSCNVSEILVVGLAAPFDVPLPLLPLQILFLNLVTDVFPALALGVGEGEADVMRRVPRDPREGILERAQWGTIALHGTLITLAVLGALGIALHALELGPRGAVTVSFLTLAFAQLWHVFDVRSVGSGLLRNEVTTNPWIWGSLLLCSGLLLAAVHVPALAGLLEIEPPSPQAWLCILGASLTPMLVAQVSTSLGVGAGVARAGSARAHVAIQRNGAAASAGRPRRSGT